MKIIIDVMSGDNAPLEQLKGSIEAARLHPTSSFILVGNEDIIRKLAEKEEIDINRNNISIVESQSVISMEDEALSVVRQKRDSSMAVGLRLLSDGKGDAFLSSGNTGALHAGSTLIVKRIKGVKKSAIATILPFKNPILLIDSGANTEIDAPTYQQFARMGSIYARKVLKIENPRVGLLNIGVERTKGTAVVKEAYELLNQDDKINFIGNVEGKELPLGACDVLVCDGFSGNIVLKLSEGLGIFFGEKLKEVFTHNIISKASAIGVKNGLKKMVKDFDASEYGGAPLLGLAKTVIKAHGGSDANAFKNAVNMTMSCVENNVNYEIADLLVPKTNSDEGQNNETH